MARNAKATKEKTPSGVIITFANGKTLSANLADFSEDIQTWLAVHGLSQKLGDSYANPDVDAMEAATDVYQNLVAGKVTDRTGTGEGSVSLLALAYCQVKGITTPVEMLKVRTVLDAKSKEFRADMRKRKDIAAAMAQIQAERKAAAAASGDTAELADL